MVDRFMMALLSVSGLLRAVNLPIKVMVDILIGLLEARLQEMAIRVIM